MKSLKTPLRYPGGKQRHLPYFSDLLPDASSIKGSYIEPFVGGASVFLSVNPRKAILADINEELIELYRGIKRNPGLMDAKDDRKY